MSKFNVYDEVTNRIIALLEQGVIPWKSPYFSKIGFPTNFASGKAYRGINIFLLGSLRYTSPYFLTFIQAKELGGHVRRGEHGSLVVKYGTYTKGASGDELHDGTAEEETHRYLKAYRVFNAAQIEGIEFPRPESRPELAPLEQCARARAIVDGMPKPPEIKHGFALPWYVPEIDKVHMPELGYFKSREAYYSTLFHELIHSTGHASRLARKSLMENEGMDAAGEAKKVYAEEELVAEMGASFLNAHAGIIEGEIVNSAAYLQGWIAALKSKDAKGWIVKAASEAQKAANNVLNLATPCQGVAPGSH